MIMVDDSTNAEMLAARAKFRERFGTPQQIGGKGTARRKAKKTHKSVVADDKKLQVTLKRLGVTQIYGIEEVFMLKEDGMALHFTNPKVQAAPSCNTYVVSGNFEERANPSSLLGMQNLGGRGGPGGLNLDPSVFTPEMLRQLQQQVTAMSAANAENSKNAPQVEDDEVPDLQVNFEDVSKE